MPALVAKLKRLRSLLARPTSMVWLLASLTLAVGVCAGWGLLHVTNLSAKFESRDGRASEIALDLREQISAYSKMTYDFLLQQDYSRMMVKEKQANSIRAGIEQNLSDLAAINDNSPAHAAIESIRTNVTQFLVLTDKALETAAEDGSAAKARVYLQDQVEPAYKNAEEAVKQLLSSRDQFDVTRFHHMRGQAFMVIAALIGLMALGVIVLLTLRSHILNGHGTRVADEPADLPDDATHTMLEESMDVEARSLATLAFASRLNRVRRESDDLRKLLQGLKAFIPATEEAATAPAKPPVQDVEALSRQGEKIAHAVGRIQHIHDQSKQFIDKLSDMMNSVQKLATDGNVVALNVTIEMAKLQSQGGAVQEEKNKAVSEQIRALATSAAAITGKLAMVLSQFRYTQEDFTRHTGELMDVRNTGTEALERVRAALQSNGQSATRLSGQREELASYLPQLEKKMADLEIQISQLQQIYSSDIETATEGVTQRSFKVISGGAS